MRLMMLNFCVITWDQYAMTVIDDDTTSSSIDIRMSQCNDFADSAILFNNKMSFQLLEVDDHWG